MRKKDVQQSIGMLSAIWAQDPFLLIRFILDGCMGVEPVVFVAVEPADGVSWQHAVLYLLAQFVALPHFISFILGIVLGVAGTVLAIACFGAVRCARGGGGNSTVRRFGSPLREGSAAHLERWTPRKSS